MKRIVSLLVLLACFVGVFGASSVLADPPAPAAPAGAVPADAPPGLEKDANCVTVSLPLLGTGADQKCIPNDPAKGGAIIAYLTYFLTLLSRLVGSVIVLMLVVAGVQYVISAGDPAAVKSAKNRIVNAITALILFLMMFAILNFLLPGGLL